MALPVSFWMTTRAVDEAGTLRRAQVSHILGRRGVHAIMVRADIFGAEVIHTDGFAGIVLDDHQDRQHAILIRIDFSKSNLYLFAGFVRFDADGELVVGLVMGERVRGPRFERRGSLVRRERGGYTHK